jgi:DNA-binding PadR family transcriptional regulator
MSKTPPTVLKFALLGLLAQSPCSGYDLRKQFAETPLKLFSGSPGSVYPALHRLHELGLLEETSPPSATGRRKQIFAVTAAGRAELIVWLQQPVTRDDVIWSLHELQLRFVFVGEFLGREPAVRFLEAFRKELAEYAVYLTAFHEATSAGESPYGRLSIEVGIEGYRLHTRWAERALSELASEDS